MPREEAAPDRLVASVDMVSTGAPYLYVVTCDVPAILGYKMGTDGKLTLIDNAKINTPGTVPFGLAWVDLSKLSAQYFDASLKGYTRSALTCYNTLRHC